MELTPGAEVLLVWLVNQRGNGDKFLINFVHSKENQFTYLKYVFAFSHWSGKEWRVEESVRPLITKGMPEIEISDYYNLEENMMIQSKSPHSRGNAKSSDGYSVEFKILDKGFSYVRNLQRERREQISGLFLLGHKDAKLSLPSKETSSQAEIAQPVSKPSKKRRAPSTKKSAQPPEKPKLSTPINRTALRQIMTLRYSREELYAVMFDLDLDSDEFPQSKTGLIVELIKHCERTNTLDALVQALRPMRPDLKEELDRISPP